MALAPRYEKRGDNQMTQIKVVTDSSIQLSPNEIAENNITIIPLSLMIDGTVYSDGVTITRTEFMEKMAAAKALPKTSQPPIGAFVDAYDDLAGDDVEILSVHMMESISGTVHTAAQAAQLSKAEVTVVDSEVTDRAMAFQVLTAAKMAAEGKSMADILARLEEIKQHTKLFLTVPSLDNLVAGGRLNKAVGVIGGLLNIKVVIEVIKGQITIAAKGRGMKTIHKYFEHIYEEMQSFGSIKRIGVSHAGALEGAQVVVDKVRAMFPNAEVYLEQTSPIISTHVGPGVVAIMYEYGE